MSPEVTQGVVGYIRVSTDEQGDSGLGLEVQRSAIEAACRRQGWTLLDVFVDVASGKSLKRSGLDAARSVLKAKRANALVVAKFDRLTRSVKDFVNLYDEAKRQGWGLVLLEFNGGALDMTSPMGEAMAHMVVTFAQLERRLIGERTRDALAKARAKGARLGRPRAIEAAAESLIIRRRQKGATLEAIAAELTAKGFEPPTVARLRKNAEPIPDAARVWTASTIQRVLGRHDLPAFPRGPRPKNRQS